MKSSINRLVLVLYVLANLTMHVADSTVEIQCPEESYLNEPSSLTCSTSQAFSNIIYKAPSGNSPQCSQTGCTPVSGFQAVPINSSCTQLTILKVQQRHAGQWGCADGDNNFVYSSLVVAERNPPCSITVDTCPVLLHEKISLTVTIQNYYCSIAFKVSLRVGSVRETLSTGVHVTGPTNITAVKEINMTKEHFGDVQLEIICQKSRTISCGGVTVLHVPDTSPTPPTPPTCPLPPGNRGQVTIAVVVTFFVTSFLCILLVVIVYKREELRDFMGRIHPAFAKKLGPTPDAPEQTKDGHSQFTPAVKA
ncbi:uncharacterized protein LOC124150134 [Haliotis rufescens]|uniref:uncharacterized protein LOC124150134 n=1 Tax=Haliotis rufescens TaxID=6454 RepID=UPI00201EE1A7|nr:uncharacterized protein LOC124150134 [Haliotis rufescens]